MSEAQAPSELEESTKVKLVAALAIQGTSVNAISQQLGISRFLVNKIKKSDEYTKYMADMADSARKEALAGFIARLDELRPLAFEALKKNLQDGKLEGVRLWSEFAGLKDKTGETKDSSITIVLPGQENQVIDVKSEVKEDE